MGIFSKKPVENKQYLLPDNVSQNIVNGDLKRLCSTPPSVETNEWIAANVNTFVSNLHLILSSLTHVPPQMKAPSIIYVDDKNKKVKCSSFNQYADLVMTATQSLLEDPDTFPTLQDVDFPDEFMPMVKRIVRNIYDIFTQIYVVHFVGLEELELIAHVNTFFLHFLLFVETFDLIPSKDMGALSDLAQTLKDLHATPKARPPA